MDKRELKRIVLLNIPYVLMGLFATNLGEAWRFAEGADASAKILGFFSALTLALENPMPSLHPQDLLIGVCCGAVLRLAVYLKGKNAKKYRHNIEYGSARWGTAKDIAPFQAPKFEDNIILTKTEKLMMSNRPKNPAHARNKNVLIIGGSGSGKTRFWLKPNLLQCHSSFVVTDPKGYISGGQRKDAFQTERLFSVCTNQMNTERRKSRGQEKDKIHSALRASVQR